MQGILLMLLLACVAALLLYSRREAFDGGAEAAIIGGEPVNDLSRYPWFCRVNITKNGKLESSCCGSLIARNLVLTGAHCGMEKQLTQPGVQGMEVVLYDGTTIGVAYSVSHSTFLAKNPAVVDAQLLLLKRPVDAQKFPPIKLAQNSLPKTGDPVTVIGAGLTKPYDPSLHFPPESTSTTVFKATLMYASPADIGALLDKEPVFQKLWRPLPTIVSAYSKDRKATCHGDSGGPMIIERGLGKDLLLGIIGFGPPGCNYNMVQYYYTFATSVPLLLPWIISTAHYMNACKFTGRVTKDRKTYRCHRSWPWDAGTWDQPGKTPAALWGKQCAQTYQCAKMLNEAARTAHAKVVPAKRETQFL